jgi:hypothetical protein
MEIKKEMFLFKKEKNKFMSLEAILTGIRATLGYIAPIIATILIILSGFAYGFSYLQPADKRGKYIHVAIGLFMGGIIIAAVSAGAEVIMNSAKGIFQ